MTTTIPCFVILGASFAALNAARTLWRRTMPAAGAWMVPEFSIDMRTFAFV